jgi:hypothetical protein
MLRSYRLNDDYIHVVPVDDLREHDIRNTCWCNPTQDEQEPLLWVHHSMDGREQFETGERKPS